MFVKKFMYAVGEITTESVYELLYFVQVNVRYMATIADVALPYVMYILGQRLTIKRGAIEIGGEIFIPVLCTVLIHYVRELANKSGKGNTIPIPKRRFTEVSDDGEVSVENNRLQELLLYVADLEDYMERKRWM